MFVRYTKNEEIKLEQNMSIEELIEFIQKHDSINEYKGVRFSADLWNPKKTEEIFLRFDNILETKMTEIRLSRLAYIKIERAKWESDYDFKTNIRVSNITKNFLKRVGGFGDSYEDILYILLDTYFREHNIPLN